MAGFLGWDDPRNQAITAVAGGLLGGKGSFSNIAGNAILGGMDQYNRAGLTQAKQQYYQAHQQEAAMKQQEALRKQLAQEKLLAQLQQQYPNDPTKALAAQLAPEEFAKSQFAAPKAPTVTERFNPETGQPEKVQWTGAGWEPLGGAKAESKPELAKLIALRDALPPGHPNRPIYDAAIQKAGSHAPGSQVQVNVDNKMGGSLAGQVGPILASSRERTEGALNLGRQGQEILKALDAGGVIAGPGATLRVKGLQIADVLGVGGKDGAERLENTRRVIRALADSAVEARKRLAGQGQVTESEAKAVEKANSGDINDLTIEELRLIAGLNIKAARFAARSHQSLVQQIPESMGAVAPFYAIPGLDHWTTEPEATPAPAAPADRPPLGSFNKP